MSSKVGKIVSCDKCGFSVFLKCTGEGVTDGGYTRWNEFEPMPEGWGSGEGRTLCPVCHQAYRKTIEEFFKEGQVVKDGNA